MPGQHPVWGFTNCLYSLVQERVFAPAVLCQSLPSHPACRRANDAAAGPFGLGRRRPSAWHRCAALAGFLAGFAALSPVQAGDIQIVIDRGSDSVEVYMAMNAATMSDAFGLPPDLLADERGLVDIEPLRQGTWDIGDALLRNVETRLGDDPTRFEAMSLMVHPAERPLPLDTPIDGMIAIAVCTVPTPETPPSLDDLRAYVGFIAYPVDPDQVVSFTLPAAGRAMLDVTVRDYHKGRLLAASQHKIADGGTLTIVTAGAPSPWLGFALVAGLGLSGLGATLALVRHRRRSALRGPNIDA
ncbi:MAG: hypothetical protein AAGC92_02230 [Pseudomonadota bacterium]